MPAGVPLLDAPAIRDRHSGRATASAWEARATQAVHKGWRMTVAFPENLRFDLARHGVKAELITGSEAGLTLNLELQGTRHAFTGDQIAVQAVGIGTLVTVELERQPQSHWIDFSLLVPTVVLDMGHSSRDLTVLAVRTTHHDKDSPLRGGQSYRFYELVGTATLFWSAETFWASGIYHLRVQGIFTFPRPGFTVELRRAEQQGENPQERRLQLTVREPAGPTSQQPTTVTARYSERTCDLYKTVIVFPEGRSLPVQETEGPWIPVGPCRDFKATQVLTSTPNVYEINAEVTCEGASAAEIRRAEEQGGNPDDLWLFVKEPEQSAEGPSTTVTTRYREQTSVRYARVVFLPSGPCIRLAPGSQELPAAAPPDP